jgi:hypothetical protein
MSFDSFVNKIKSAVSFVDGSHHNIPVSPMGNSIPELISELVDPNNRKPLAFIKEEDVVDLSMLDGYKEAFDEYDVDTWLDVLVNDLFELSAAVDGRRSEQIQNICVGQLSLQHQMELAQIRSGGQQQGELKDVV